MKAKHLKISEKSVLAFGSAINVHVMYTYYFCISGREQLSEEEVTATRRIASVRIHVERAINRIKNYRIFKSDLSIKSKKTIDMMVLVCAGLCNFKAPLIADSS